MGVTYDSVNGQRSPQSFDTYDEYVQANQGSAQPLMDQGQFASLKQQRQAPETYEPSGPPAPPSVGQQAIGIAENKGQNIAVNQGINAAQNYANSPSGVGGTDPNAVKLPQGATSGPNGEVLKPDGTATDPTTGQTIGTWAQGAAGAYLIYNGVRQYQDGNHVQGGLSAAYGGTLGATALGSEAAASALPYVGAGYGIYNLGKLGLQKNYSDQAASNALQGGMGGAALGASFSPLGMGVGAGLGALYGAGTAMFGSQKGLMQRVRDQWRDNMGKSGLFDPTSYMGTLADGTPYDYGNVPHSGFGPSSQNPANIDQSKPSTVVATSYANALASLQGATGKAKQAIAAAWIQAATNNGAIEDPKQIRANFQHFLTQLKVSPDQAYQQIGNMAKADIAKGDPDGSKKQYYDVFLNNIQQLYGQAAPTSYDQVVNVMQHAGSQVTPQNWNGQPMVYQQQNYPGLNLKSAQAAASPSASPDAAATDPTSGLSALMAAQQNQAIASTNQQMASQKQQLRNQAVMSILQNALANNSQSSGIGQAYTDAFKPMIQQRLGGRPNG